MKTQERTTVKEEIKKAFLQVLLRKPYADVTVSDLVNEAQVARMSFYRNFNSLDDVLESIACDMIRDFNEEIAPVLQRNDEREWRALLFGMIYRLIQYHKEFGLSFREFAKTHANHSVIISRMQEKGTLLERKLENKTAAEKYTIIGKLNIIHGIIGKWAISGMQETPEELVDIIMAMISKL